jgi:4-hydroxy-2-oxoheptanedioate aldolase
MSASFQLPRGMRQALLRGRPKFGVLLSGPSQMLVELCGFSGADYVFLDGEHGDGIDVAAAAPLIRAAELAGVPTFVRVPRNGADVIQRVLDAGALGVCVPHVRTAADAERLVSYAKFAPAGERAVSPITHSARYGAGSWEEHWPIANEETMTMAIVEDTVAMENLEPIAAVPGLDVIWIGVGDLAQTMGLGGKVGHPEVLAAKRRGLEACRRHGKAAFTTISSAAASDPGRRREEVAEYLKEGYSMFAWTDVGIFGGSLRHLLDTARAPVGGTG